MSEKKQRPRLSVAHVAELGIRVDNAILGILKANTDLERHECVDVVAAASEAFRAACDYLPGWDSIDPYIEN